MLKYPSTILLLATCLGFVHSQTQNLVPNGSMEMKTECPGTSGGIDLATGWFSSLNSPDYYHACNHESYAALDSNLAGYQRPFHGNAYCALVTKNASTDYHEHQGIKLIKPLEVGKTYQCRMWVSLTELSSYASNKIGFQFGMSKESSVNNISQVYTNMVIPEKRRWVQVSGSFVADQPYTYVFVGNFFEDAKTEIKPIAGGSYEGAYYFIDSISVSTIDPMQTVNVIPTDQEGKYTVTGAKPNSYLYVTLASGEEIYSTTETFSNMVLDLSSFGHGTYYIMVESINGETIRKIVTY